jgi:hypothetical protein
MIVTPQFDEGPHRYTVDGVEQRSVTTILKDLGLYPMYSEDTMYYRDRGTAVHTATEFLDVGVLDKTSTHPEILPFVECWEAFCADFGLTFRREEIEIRAADPSKRVAGTIEPPPCTALQLAGYAELSEAPQARRASVHLRPGCNPPYRLHEYTDPNDFLVWSACVQIHASEPARRICRAMLADKELTYGELIDCLTLFAWRKKE